MNNQPALTNPSTDPKRWRALVTLLAAGFLTLLAVSILNVSVPSLTKSLQLSATDVQWIMSGYSLTFGLALVPAGRLGDSFGRRRLFFIGVVFFTFVSITAGCATSAGMLVAMRLCEGVAAAIISPQVIGLIQQMFTGAERAQAFGYFGLSIGVSTAIGPPLGGLFLSLFGTDYGWRASFLVNVPVCLIVLVLAVKFLPTDQRSRRRKTTAEAQIVTEFSNPQGVDATATNTPSEPSEGVSPSSNPGRLDLDLPGIILLGLGVMALMLPFVSAGPGTGGLSAAPWWLLAVTVLCFGLFWWWETRQEKRGKDVILPRSLVRDPSYRVGTILISIFVSGWQAMFIVYTLYLQQGLGLHPLTAGLMQIPIAVASAIVSPFSARLLLRWGRWLLVFSAGLAAVGMIGSILVSQVAPVAMIPGLLVVVMFLVGAGAGLFNSPAQSLSLVTVPVETGGTAGGFGQTAQRVTGAVVMAFVTLIFYLQVGPGASATPGSAVARQIYTQAYTWSAVAIVVIMLITVVLATADSVKRPENPML